MSDFEKIREILNKIKEIPKWDYSDDWLSKIASKCSNNFQASKIREAHNNLYIKLSNDLNKHFKSSSFAKSLEEDVIEDEVSIALTEKLQKFGSNNNANEKTFLSTAIKNTLINKTKVKKHSPIGGIEDLPVTEENITLDSTLLNEIFDLDGTKQLQVFLKNLSIAQKKKITNEKSIEKLNCKVTQIASTVFYDDLGNKYNSDSYSFIPNFFKFQTICKTPERLIMFKARDLVEKSKSQFNLNVIQPLKDKGEYTDASELQKNTPVLSALALDKNGNIIKTAYKGQCGEMKHHCEFTLFESVFEEEDWVKIKGGTVFVTLEPCHKRGTFICENTGLLKPKIPCAVRCVESGIASIYIAHHDPDELVKGHGIKTLETGQYTFNKDQGVISAKGFPDLEAALLLQKYFQDKGYKVIEEDKEKITYQIGTPVNVKLFHTDIALQIMNINSAFLGNKLPKAFITTTIK